MRIPLGSQQNHVEILQGEFFIDNLNQAEFNGLPYAPSDKRMGQMAFDDSGELIKKGGVLPEARVYPVFVLQSAYEAGAA